MKRWVLGVTIALVFIVGGAVGVAASSLSKQIDVQYKDIKIKVNDRLVDTGTSEAFVVVDEGRTYVPARYLAEALGAKVSWDGATNSVMAYTPGYIHWRDQNGITTYASPYYGVSIQLPTGGKVNRPANEFFQVDSPIGLLDVIRWDKTALMDVDTLAATFKSKLPGYQFSASQHIQVTGALSAVDFSATGTQSNIAVVMRVRIILTDANVWILGTTYSQSLDSQYGPAVQKALDSFTLPTNS